MKERGLPFTSTHEPGGTPVGDAIRRLFLTRDLRPTPPVEALLVFASRRQHLDEVIEPALAAGRHVLCDRFTDSTRAYQGWGRDQDLGWIEELDRLSTGGRLPDRTFVFDVEPEVARGRRGDGDRLDAEALDFYRRVAEGYRAVARAAPERVVVIDARGPKDATWAQVRRALERLDLGGEGTA